MLRLADNDEKLIARLRQRQENQRAANRGRIEFGTFRDEATGSEMPMIELYGEIGFDYWGDGSTISKQDFAAQLKELGDVPELAIRIDSPGGDVFDGITIYNRLVQLKARIHVLIDGEAASIAAVIAMAGDEIAIAENGMMMIHDAWGIEIGNSEDMQAMAAILDKLDGQIARTFAARTGKTDAAVRKLMDEESYFTGAEAVEAGLADSIIAAKTAPAPGKGDARDHAGAARGLAPVTDQDEREAAAPGNAAPPDHPDAEAEEVAVRLRTLDLDDDEAEGRS